MKNNSLVQSTSGKLNIFGNGGFGNVTDVSNGTNNGIYLGNEDAFPIDNTKISSATGDIALTGIGGDGNTFYSDGIVIYHGAVVESTGTGIGAANITITGTGGNGLDQNFGVVIQAAGNVTTVDGIYNAGVWFDNDFTGDITGNNNGNILSAGKGNITINGSGNNGGASIISTTLNGIGVAPAGALIGGAADTGNITLNGNNGDIILQNGTRVQTQGDLFINTASNLNVIKSSLAAKNITIGPVHNVTLTGGSTITATNALDIDNIGVFSSDTAGVLRGLTLELEQTQTGSIQNAVDAVNTTSGTTNLTLDTGTWNENITIDGHNNFNLRGQGATNSIINSGGGAGPVLTVKNAGNDNVYGLAVNGTSGVTKGIDIENVTSGNFGGAGVSSFEHNNGATNALTVTNALTGIYVLNSHIAIDHATINNATTGISVNGGTGNQITNNTLFAITGDGIDVNGGSSVNIAGNTLTGAPSVNGKGINLTNVGGTSTIGDGTAGGVNTISQFGNTGIALNSSTANVNNNSVTGGINGITVTSSNSSIVQNNTISGTSFGTVVETSNGVGISHNTIDSAAEGIYIDQSNNGTVTGNLIGTNSFFNIGVFVSQSATVSITGNTLANGLSTGTGVLALSNTGITVGSNTVNTSGNGVAIYGGSTANVSNNILTSSPSSTNTGVNLNNVTGPNIVDGNTINQFGTGVLLTNTSGTHVGGNTVNIIGASNSAVVLDGSSNTKLVSNTLTGAPSPTGVGIKAINGSNNLTIGGPLVTDGNTITLFGTGISLAGSATATIQNNKVTINSISGDAVDVTGGSNVTVSNNTLTGAPSTTGTAVKFSSVTGTNAVNSNLITLFGTGVSLTSTAAHVGSNDITVTNGNSSGIVLNAAANSVIVSNKLTGAPSLSGTAILSTNSNNLTIGGSLATDGNTIKDFGTGISLSGTTKATIANNVATGITGSGIAASNSSTLTITGNDLTGSNPSPNAGISITGGTGSDVLNLNKITKFAQAVVLTNAGTANKVTGTIATGITGDGIDITTGSNVTVSGNTLTGAPSNAGVGVNLSGVTGTNTVNSNTISQYGTGITLTNTAATHVGSNVVTVTNTNSNAIILNGSTGATIVGNTLTGAPSPTGVGIKAINGSSNLTIGGPLVTDGNTITLFGTGISLAGINTATIQHNQVTVDSVSGNAIDVTGGSAVTVSNNSLTGAPSSIGAGVNLNGVSGVNIVSSNNITQFRMGVFVNSTDNTQLASNTIEGTGNGGTGIGVLVQNSNDTQFLGGDDISQNGVGIQLDNAQNTNINGANLHENGVGLFATNGSGNTLVSATQFTNNTTSAIMLNGVDTSLQFGDNNSVFIGPSAYFVLQNDAMQGKTLDARFQTFNGTQANQFTFAQWLDAENNHTTDILDNAALGRVLYGNFPLPTVSFDLNILDQSLQNFGVNSNTKFSYAGRIITNTIDQNGYNFTVPTTNLSLLATPTAGLNATHNVGNGGTPQQLANLAPAAGGIDSNCANDILANALIRCGGPNSDKFAQGN